MRTINSKYEEARTHIGEYINEMEWWYNYHKEMMIEYNNSMLDIDYDYNKGLKFCKTWEILQGLAPQERNLYMCYLYCNCKASKCIEIFGGYKNVKTLSSMLCKIKKKIKEKYDALN